MFFFVSITSFDRLDISSDMITLVEIRSFDRNTFRQTFSRFGHVIRSYFGYAYKIRHQIECRLLYCIKFYIISVSIPFGKHSANIQPFRSCESAKVQLGLKFGKKIKTNWPTYFIACYSIYFGIKTFQSCESAKFQLGLKFDKKIKTNWPTYFVVC